MSRRVVLVTGCSAGGIGYSLCEEFERQGCKVYATARRVHAIAGFKTENVEKLELDVNSEENIAKVLAYIMEKEGKIDVLVNNAGVLAPGPMLEMPMDEVKNVFETNTFSILRVCRAVTPIMVKRGAGTVVNIGSSVGEVGTPWNGIYCASKAAVLSFSEVLSMELKPFGISVVHVAPAAIKSNISSNAQARFQLQEGTLYKKYLPDIIRRIHASQGPISMPSEKLAKAVVAGVLQKKPPRYMSLGGGAWIFYLFKWLPRSLVLFLVWRACTVSSRG